MLYKALLLLTAVTSALISILVEAQTRKDIISETEQQTWNISDEQLKVLVLSCKMTNWTKRPDHVFVRSPTNVSFMVDAYKRFKKQEVHRILTVKNCSIPVDIAKESVIIKTNGIFNNKTVPDKFNVGKIQETVEESLSVTWHTDGNLTIDDRDVKYSTKEMIKDFPDLAKVLYRNNVPDFSFTGPWGNNTKILNVATVGSEDEIPEELQPGELVGVNLVATRGSVELHVNYEAYLSGNVLVYYRDEEADYDHYYFRDLNECLNKTGMRMVVHTDAVFTFAFFTDISIAFAKDWNYTHFNKTNQVLF